jgi:hypothetical protein
MIRMKNQGNKTGGTTTPKEIFSLAAPSELKSSFSYQVKNQLNAANFSEENSFRK